jgi:hypothetical protein
MFGDAFSGRPTRAFVSLFTGTVEGLVQPLPASSSAYSREGVFSGTGVQVIRFNPIDLNTFTTPASARFGAITLTPAPSFTPAPPLFIPFGPPPNSISLAENPQVTSAVQGAQPQGTAVRYLGGNAINPFFFSEGGPFYDVYVQYGLFRLAEVLLPSPSAGGVVGRTKIADDNSPIPRDRFIFNHDYFENAAIGAGGHDVRRSVPGIEKTFFNMWTSIELRLPFAGTIDPTATADGVAGRVTQFGNVNITLKSLLYRGETLFVAGGLGLSLPTAEDTRLILADGSDFIRYRNQAVVYTPYFAALYVPDERLFAQLWLAWSLAGTGNGIDVLGQFAGRIKDQPIAQIDGQFGYWLYRSTDRTAWLQGLAPFLELHYNATSGPADVVYAGPMQIGTPGSLNELNLTAGATAQVGNNLFLTAGVVVPLKSGLDRTFDYQVGVRGTLFFGPTARSRNAAYRAQSF